MSIQVKEKFEAAAKTPNTHWHPGLGVEIIRTHCFKHLLPEFKSIFSANGALLALWKIFHFCRLALGFMKKVTDIYGELLVTTICPSTARWTVHDWASKYLRKGCKHFCTHLVYV